jgi:hypothetical protein
MLIRVKIHQHSHGCEGIFEHIEGYLLIFLPCEGSTLMGQEGQGLYNMGIIVDEVVMEICKTQEYMDIIIIT